VAVEFLPSEARGRDHLLAIAQQDRAVTSARRHQRLPIDLPIRWCIRGSSQEHRGLLQDISIGGASIRTTEPIGGEGTDIFLTVVPPGAEVAMEVSARVAWTAPGVGFGLAWRARDGGGSRRIKELVRRMEQLTEDRETHDVFPDLFPPPADARKPAPAGQSWQSEPRAADGLQHDGLSSRWAS
jgi:hypothetical protein